MLLGFGAVIAVFPNKVVSQTIYDESLRPQFEQLEATPEAIAQGEALYEVRYNQNLCSCVAFVKGITGFSETVGKAKNWPHNATLPQIGGVVITNESSAGHVAYIKTIVGNIMTLTEANFTPCQKDERKMVIDDSKILGFWINN